MNQMISVLGNMDLVENSKNSISQPSFNQKGSSVWHCPQTLGWPPVVLNTLFWDVWL